MKLADIIEILSKRFLNYKIHELEKYNAENINVNFFQYIDVIGDMESPTYGELAQKLNLSKPAITAIVNKLIKQYEQMKQVMKMFNSGGLPGMGGGFRGKKR